MENKIDPFGFKGQSQDYELERPRYPQKFIDKILEAKVSTPNYLDIASGTGILFFELAPRLTGNLVMNDRSFKQLSVAKEKLKNLNLDESLVQVIESDAFEIHQKLQKPIKFNLVTIAQALHWLDYDKFCRYVGNELVEKEGLLAVLGYFREGFDYNFPESLEFSKLAQQHYDQFNSTVYPYYDCNHSSLEKEYSDFDFGKYFENIERFSHINHVELSVDRLIRYLGTSSAYNMCKNKLENQKEFVDPLQQLKKNIESDLEKYYKKNHIQPKEKPISLRIHYFMLLLSKIKKFI